MLADIVQQSYEPLTRLIREFRDLRFTLNVNFSLIELLHERFPHIVNNVHTAYEAGTLELTTTGAYHPIFPLIPGKEVRRQIEINNEGNRKFLSRRFQPKGVFPPELALTSALVRFFKELGYEWTIADDGNLEHYGMAVPYDKLYSIDGFVVFFRSNFWANRFADHQNLWSRGDEFVEDLAASLDRWMGPGDGYLIIALDGETFGHHHKELDERFLQELFRALQDAENFKTAHLSELARRFPKMPQELTRA